MGKINSFRDVLEDLFNDEIFEELSTYIEENPSEIDCSSNIIEYPDEASLDFFEVKRVNIKKTPNNKLDFDVIVSAELIIAETVSRNRETDGVEQWFRISCSAFIEEDIRDFSIADIDIYNNSYNSGKENNLSEYFVPIIYKEQYDTVAKNFLKKYYPEALEKPRPVPVDEIVKRMGLNIHKVHITKQLTVFGQIFFSDCNTHYYDYEEGIYRELEVKKGTILVDPNVFFMRNLGSMNNTIIHECLHWDLHRIFFKLKKLYNKGAHALRCKVVEGVRTKKNRTPFDWMEIHANNIAPRVLMPEKQTRQKIEELIAKIKKNNPANIMKKVVCQLSKFFKVSKLSAKIRMIDLGYNEAIGVLTYIDNRYVASHSCKKTKLKNNQTFSIGMKEALHEYEVNQKLREMLNSGKYIYVDSHFCIKNSKYIQQNEYGCPELTDYAREHIEECCLIFEIRTRTNNRYGVKYYKKAVLFRDAISKKIIETKYVHSEQNKNLDLRAEEFKKIGDKTRKIANIAFNLPSSFGASLVEHMGRLNCTIEALADKSLVGERTIQRIRNDIRYIPKLKTIIALCVGLQLPPALGMDLVSKAGYEFKACYEDHVIYQFILNTKYQSSIYECNEMLRATKCKPLSKEE